MDPIVQEFSTDRMLTRERPAVSSAEGGAFPSCLFVEGEQGKLASGGLRTQGYFKQSQEGVPLVSVITVVYNGHPFLETAIRSVLAQGYPNVEYIIVDGGSTDSSLAVVRRYESVIDYWVSENDDGIYDAMNKGLRLASGEIVGIINADDCYELNAIEDSTEALQTSGADYSVGLIRKSPSGKIVKPICPLDERYHYQEMMYPHIGAFIKRDVYKAVGLFDKRYRTAADFDMALRIHRKGFQPVCVDKVLACHREGGASDALASVSERWHIAVRYGRNPFVASAVFVVQVTKYLMARYLPPGLMAWLLRLSRSRFQYDD